MSISFPYVSGGTGGENFQLGIGLANGHQSRTICFFLDEMMRMEIIYSSGIGSLNKCGTDVFRKWTSRLLHLEFYIKLRAHFQRKVENSLLESALAIASC